MVPGLQGLGSWDLIIENKGASSAVEVIVDAGKLTPQDGQDHIIPNLSKYLLAPKTLVPGARRRVMWAHDSEDMSIRAGVVEPRVVTVTYLDDKKVRAPEQEGTTLRWHVRGRRPPAGRRLSSTH